MRPNDSNQLMPGKPDYSNGVMTKTRAAVFDVDGTLISRNCTWIFMRYLFDHSLIEPHIFNAFVSKYNLSDSSGNNNYEGLITESLKLFSFIRFPELQQHWNRCFEESVKHDLNPLMVDCIRKLQANNTLVILASGSYHGLIKNIAAVLGIPEENILASGEEEPPCYGEVKRNRVLEMLTSRHILISETVVYSDNVSDIKLLSEAGEGYWTGKNDDYIRLGLSHPGIKESIVNGKQGYPENLLNGEILEYYHTHESFFNHAINCIIPEECTHESIEYIAGPIELSFDLTTLGTNFFKPAREYIDKAVIKSNCLCASLLLEAGGIDPRNYPSLVAVTELLETSAMMFSDIKERCREENFHSWHNSRIENAVTGNISIALLSMVTHNILFNRLPVNTLQKQAILETITNAVSDALLGNGLKLYREENKVACTADEYCRVAVLINGGLFSIYFNLCSILGQQQPSEKEKHSRESFVNHLSIALQLKRDRGSELRVYDRDTDQLVSDCGTELLYHVNRDQSESLKHKHKALESLDSLGFSPAYKQLLQQYIHYILQ